MRAVLQRVVHASVKAGNEVLGEIQQGWLVLLGVEQEDALKDALALAEKVAHVRAFSDEVGKMNRSVLDIGGSVLVVSQFTLLGDCRKGRRPSFVRAAHPEVANDLYEQFCQKLRDLDVKVEQGRFAEKMKVHLINEGPVTLLLDSRKVF